MKTFFSLLTLAFLFSCEKPKTSAIPIHDAPTTKVIDTDFSKGQLNHIQEIDLADLVKFHGHLCDGLVVGYLGLHEALLELYPDGMVDRTNTRIVSKSSPCLTDVAIYLTGGRYQYNSFYVDNEIEGFYQVQRIDTKKTFTIQLKADIKPKAIDSLGNLAIQGKLSQNELNELKELEDEFSMFLLENSPSKIFNINTTPSFHWKPNNKNNYTKTDILNK